MLKIYPETTRNNWNNIHGSCIIVGKKLQNGDCLFYIQYVSCSITPPPVLTVQRCRSFFYFLGGGITVWVLWLVSVGHLSLSGVESEQTKPSRARIVVVVVVVLFFFTFFHLYSTITRNTLTINNITIKTNYSYTRNANSERAFKLRKVELTTYAWHVAITGMSLTKNEKKDYNNYYQRRYKELLIFKLVFCDEWCFNVALCLAAGWFISWSWRWGSERASEFATLRTLCFLHWLDFLVSFKLKFINE